MLKSPYPYFGGKSRIAAEIWKRIGDTPNYVEPFFGSGAVLLARPATHFKRTRTETVNDKDGYISNFWRAVQADPDEVAKHADWPVNENDLHARHAWLLHRKDALSAKLEGDPDYYDAKIAGWWVWGMALWIGSGFCSGGGSWIVQDGQLMNGNAGRGIQRQMPHLGDAGQGIQRQMPHLGNAGQGIRDYFDALQQRLRRVRVACGDWTRVMGDSVTFKHGVTGIVLDPPYTMDTRDALYIHDSSNIALEVREWAIANGNNPELRIAYCGYEDGFSWPEDWTEIQWKARPGFQSAEKGNSERERVWFSPHCLKTERQASLFDFQAEAANA